MNQTASPSTETCTISEAASCQPSVGPAKKPRKTKTRILALLIEHGPCCIFSFAAGFLGLPAFRHNPVLELGFAFLGAIFGEYLGHKLFHPEVKHAPGFYPTLKRYGLSLSIGLLSWLAHQLLLHDGH